MPGVDASRFLHKLQEAVWDTAYCRYHAWRYDNKPQWDVPDLDPGPSSKHLALSE
ncbi:hypothetical protein PISMIDRAFT_16130 [Pisolithus microcarpus 441]|uniref:Uncharacterized protein n=1 Tax=Pisolithus microcarpus 441 TaxID=765257 RepID=A0A0C9XUE6_9AGAM|nr:hypothetical protein PISMIDRAFT_16130 [Pisolithus microcarpus 441]